MRTTRNPMKKNRTDNNHPMQPERKKARTSNPAAQMEITPFMNDEMEYESTEINPISADDNLELFVNTLESEAAELEHENKDEDVNEDVNEDILNLDGVSKHPSTHQPQKNSSAEDSLQLFLHQLDEEYKEEISNKQEGNILNVNPELEFPLNVDVLQLATGSETPPITTSHVNPITHNNITNNNPDDSKMPYADTQLIKRSDIFPVPYLTNQYHDIFDLEDILTIQPTNEDTEIATSLACSYKTFESQNEFEKYFNLTFSNNFFQKRTTFQSQARFFKAFMIYMRDELNTKMRSREGVRVAQMFFDILSKFPAYSQIKLFSFAMHLSPYFAYLALHKMVQVEARQYKKKKVDLKQKFYFHRYYLIFLSNEKMQVKDLLKLTVSKIDTLLFNGIEVLYNVDANDVLRVLNRVVSIYHQVLNTYNNNKSINICLAPKWKLFLVNFLYRVSSDNKVSVYKTIIQQDLSMMMHKGSDYKRIIIATGKFLNELCCAPHDIVDLMRDCVNLQKKQLKQYLSDDDFHTLLQVIDSMADKYKQIQPVASEVVNAPQISTFQSDTNEVESISLNHNVRSVNITINKEKLSYKNSQYIKTFVSASSNPYLINPYPKLFEVGDVISITPSEFDINFAKSISENYAEFNDQDYLLYFNLTFDKEFYKQRNTYESRVKFFKAFCYSMYNATAGRDKIAHILFNVLDNFPAYSQLKLFTYALRTFPTFVFEMMIERLKYERTRHQSKNKYNFDNKFHFHYYFVIFVSIINLEPNTCNLFYWLDKDKLMAFLNESLIVLGKIDTADIIISTRGVVTLHQVLLGHFENTPLFEKWKSYLSRYLDVIQDKDAACKVHDIACKTIIDVYFLRMNDKETCLKSLRNLINFLLDIHCEEIDMTRLIGSKIYQEYKKITQFLGSDALDQLVKLIKEEKLIDAFREKSNNANQTNQTTPSTPIRNAMNNYSLWKETAPRSIGYVMVDQPLSAPEQETLTSIDMSEVDKLIDDFEIMNVSNICKNAQLPYTDSQLIMTNLNGALYLTSQYNDVMAIADVIDIEATDEDLLTAKSLAENINNETAQEDFNIYYNLLFDDKFYLNKQNYESQVRFFKAFMSCISLNATQSPKANGVFFDILNHFSAYTQIKLFSYAMHAYPNLVFQFMNRQVYLEFKLNNFLKYQGDASKSFHFYRYLPIFFATIESSSTLCDFFIKNLTNIQMILNGVGILVVNNILQNDVISVLNGDNPTLRNTIYPAIANVCFTGIITEPQQCFKRLELLFHYLMSIQCPESTIMCLLKERLKENKHIITAALGQDTYEKTLKYFNQENFIDILKKNQFWRWFDSVSSTASSSAPTKQMRK